MKKIILLTDDLMSAQRAVQCVMQLLDGEPIEFVLVNAFMVGKSRKEEVVSKVDQLRSESEEFLRSITEVISKQFQMFRFRPLVMLGSPTNAVLRLLAEEAFDLVVLGAKEIENGSHDLISKVNVPVLAIPNLR